LSRDHPDFARNAIRVGLMQRFLSPAARVIYHLKQVLTAEELSQLREIATRVRWDDGRKTAGAIAAPHKHNTEAPHDSREAQAAAEITLRAIRRHPQFFSAALPALMSPPMMNRYTEGMDYGDHCDAAILGGGAPMRADLSATLFISDPEDYDGGELVTDVTPGGYAAKLPAGDLILYQSNTVHHVAKVTRGTRIAMIFWAQSMVRDAQQRALLYSMFQTLESLERPLAGTPELTQLYTYYYNLIRMWATP
jgi:PKHD-type hydroxylase